MSARPLYETDSALEARHLAIALGHIGLEVEVVAGRARRYAVRERTRWDRAFLAWRKRFSGFLRGCSSVQSGAPPSAGRTVRLGASRSKSPGGTP